MAITIDWTLDCDQDTALSLLRKATDTPGRRSLTGSEYVGNISQKAFKIWPKLEGFRGVPNAAVRGRIVQTGEQSRLTAVIDVTFPYRHAPSSPAFWWILVPLTLFSWIYLLITILGDPGDPPPATFLPPAIGIVTLLLGFYKYLGSTELIFIKRFLYNTFSKHIVDA